MLETTILAVLQGVAEFLPISSSGHLVLGKQLLGLREAGLRLDVFLHVGTLLAVFAFYWRVIARILVEKDWRYVLRSQRAPCRPGWSGSSSRKSSKARFRARAWWARRCCSPGSC